MSKPKAETVFSISYEVHIPSGKAMLEGELKVPFGASGIVLFAHGSGSSRHSPRNQFVAGAMRDAGIGTLLFDLLTRKEEALDTGTGRFRFDIRLLAQRLEDATYWIANQTVTRNLRVGYFGASTGGGAALAAAAELGKRVSAVVSRGGRPDLAGEALMRVESPTLLIVGGYDEPVISMNREAFEKLHCDKELFIVPKATHLFEEPGKLQEVAALAAAWFKRYL